MTPLALLSSLLPPGTELDEDVCAYLVSLAEEGEEESDVVEGAGPLLADLLGGEEEEANAVAHRLWESVRGNPSDKGGGQVDKKKGQDEEKKLLTGPVSLKGLGAHLGGERVLLPDEEEFERKIKLKSTGLERKDASYGSDKDSRKLARRREREEKDRLNQIESLTRDADSSLLESAVVVQRGGSGGGIGNRDIRMEQICVGVAGKELIDDCSLNLVHGHKFGLVGQNGTGKTTFLRHIAAHAIEGIPPACQILHVEQEIAGDTRTVLDVVLAADIEREGLLKEEAKLLAEGGRAKVDAKVDEKLAMVYRKLVEIDADGSKAKAATILAGLGFSAEEQLRTTASFSGGWRMRVALARALFIEPDLLLLDEPTNHLDLHAVVWLETYLKKWKGTVLIVSHSRGFLNSVVTDIVHLAQKKLQVYKGSNYDAFQSTRIER